MIIKEIGIENIMDVSKLYNELIKYIKNETNDIYFDTEEIDDMTMFSFIEESLKNQKIKLYIAIDNNEVVGFIAGEIVNCFLPISKVKNVGYIQGAFVKDKHRKKGVIKKLEIEIIKWFKENNIKYVDLNVITNNLVGKKSWEKLGYQTFREQMRKEI